MPIECELLAYQPSPFPACPYCQVEPFRPFMRGEVQGRWRKLFGRPYCAVICAHCKEIVGYEKPLRGGIL